MLLKIIRLKWMCYAVRLCFPMKVTDLHCVFWIMNMVLLCGSETHFYLFSLFNKDLVNVLRNRNLSFSEA